MEEQATGTFSRPRAARAVAEDAARERREPFAAGAVYAASTLTSLAIGTAVGATAALPSLSAGVLATGLVLAVLATPVSTRVARTATLWALMLTAGAVPGVALLATTGLPIRPYGDGALFAQFVSEGRAVPRWLLGSAGAAATHAAIWEMPAVRSMLPVALQSSTAFLAVLGSSVMVAGTWGLFRRWPGRLSVLLPTLTPVWVLFASGYVEYYPLVAVPFVASLAWLFERPLEARTAHEIGAVAALLALLYVGFVPTACFLLVAYAAARPAQALRATLTAITVAAIAIATCWPEGIASYFRVLYSVMNVGDAHLPARYAGQVAGPESIMFALDAVRAWARAREVLYLLVWGGGWWTLPLLIVAARRAWASGGEHDHRLAWRDARPWLGAALAGWHLYYLVFMVPRLGPTADIDLFFPTYLTLAFLAGLLLDRTRNHGSSMWMAAAIACALASLACAGPWLVWLGLPPVP